MLPIGITISLLILASTKSSLARHSSSEVLKHELERVYDIIDRFDASSGKNSDLEALRSTVTAELRATNEVARMRREADGGEVKVADGFLEKASVSSDDLIDVAFFSHKAQDAGEAKYTPYIAALNSTHVSLHTLESDETRLTTAYRQPNGRAITASSFSNFTLLAVATEDDGIVILNFLPGERLVSQKQTIRLNDILHTAIWERKHLGIFLTASTSTSVFVFEWLGEHFDRIQTFDFGAAKVLPFQRETFSFLAIAGSQTIVLEYSVSAGKYLVAQVLPKSLDVESFSLRVQHLEEKYMCVCHETTIVYKEMAGRYVPFQQLPSARSCVSLIRDDNIVLGLLIENELRLYQYDGWRFVDVDLKIENVGKVGRTQVFDENLLIGRPRGHRWKIVGVEWRRVDSWGNLLARTKSWCHEAGARAKRSAISFDKSAGPLKLANAHVGTIRIDNVDGDGIRSLRSLSEKFEAVTSKLAQQRLSLSPSKISNDLRCTTLRAKKVKLRGQSSRHRIQRIKSEDEKFADLANLRRVDDAEQTLTLENVRLIHSDWTKCPLPSFRLDQTIVRNDTEFRELQENSLKTVGDQEISAIHTFDSLTVENATIPLELSRGKIKLGLYLEEVRTKSLIIADGGILLPLDGTPQVISGSVKGSKVTLNGTVDLRGKFKGAVFDRLLPTVVVTETLNLTDDYNLRRVRITNSLRTADVSRESGSSLSEILRNTVPLAGNMSQHLTLNAATWKSVNMSGASNFVSTSGRSQRIVAQKTIAHSVALTDAGRLPVPKMTVPFCASLAISQSLKNASLVVDRLYAESLSSGHVTEKGELNETVFSFVSSIKNADISRKHFDRAKVRDIWTLDATSSDSSHLRNLSSHWLSTNLFRGPLTVSKFSAASIEDVVRFEFPLPTSVKTIRSKKNIRVGRVNGVDFDSFASNVLTARDAPARNVTFREGVSCHEIRAGKLPVDFTRFRPSMNSKRILGDLFATEVTLPHDFAYSLPSKRASYVLTGSAVFEEEPTVERVNYLNFDDLARSVWMKNRPVFLSGREIKLTNVTFRGEIESGEPIFGEIIKLAPTELLSRTREQTIQVSAKMTKVQLKNVVGGRGSRLNVSAADLNDLLRNTLTCEGQHIIYSRWQFDELDASDSLRLNGRVNGLNLTTDVVRHDANVNIVSGRKTTVQVTTKTLNHKQFEDWVDEAITLQDPEMIVVKGSKVFSTVEINKLTVSGTISGRKMDRMLRKSASQEIDGFKTITGFLTAPSFRIDSLINDVDITKLTESQLKRNATVQRISGKIVLKDGLEIVGNMQTNGRYQSVELRTIDEKHEKLQPVAEKMEEILEIAKAIDVSMQEPALYVRKLEADPNVTSIQTAEINEISSAILTGNRTIDLLKNVSTIKSFEADKLLILKNGSSIFICTVMSNEEISPEQVTEINVPNLIDVSTERTKNSVWIIVKLSTETLALRYDLWGQLKSYDLPHTDEFLLKTVPSGELLMMMSDGIWKLNGLGNPKRIVTIPLAEFVEFLPFEGPNFYLKSASGGYVLKTRYTGH